MFARGKSARLLAERVMRPFFAGSNAADLLNGPLPVH